jgi:hypothetical protein
MAVGFSTVSANAVGSSDTAYLYSAGGALTMTSPNYPLFYSPYPYPLTADSSSASILGPVDIITSPIITNPVNTGPVYVNPILYPIGIISPIVYQVYVPAEASVTSGGDTVNVYGYASVYGYAASATDTATFNDSGSGDKFVGSIPYSYMASVADNSLFEMAVGYSTVTATVSASSGSGRTSPFDAGQAYLYSDGGALMMSENTSSIALNGTTVTVNGYPAVLAFASSMGLDTATFLPASDMMLDISSSYSYLGSNLNFDAAIGYQTVLANSPTSSLTMFNVGSGETFVGGPASATLTSGTFRATVNNFTSVLAEGTADNTATLNASTGQNSLLAYGSQATLTEGTGGTVATSGFGLVYVNAAAGGTNRKAIGALDFVLSLSGNWPDG